MSDRVKITTDLVVDAARITSLVYKDNARKHFERDPDRACIMDEMRRAALMDALANDDNLCEMLAGRINQLGHGT